MEKYNANCLPTLMEESNGFIAEFKKLKTPKEISAYREDVLPPIKEVQEKISDLDEFIDYRQSLADKAKDEGDNDEIQKLLYLKLVGLIHLRKCKKTLISLLSIYTDAEESEKKSSGAKLLEMIKAPSPMKGFSAPRAVEAPPAAGCGAPTPAEADEEQNIIEESMIDNSPKVKKLVEIDEHATEFEERPDVAVHEFARNDIKLHINLRTAQIVDRLASIFMETASLQSELLRLQNGVAE
jgi:hypothetical protein